MGGDFYDNRLVVRCTTWSCHKLLGVVDEKGRLVTESKRKGWPIRTEMEKGRVTCTNCGTVLEWNAYSTQRATPVKTNALKETSHA
ncbi:hypothetical protein LCGC14_0659200 [marine sediment metagenome]|uniref:Uncharacterized protein n=1 Tax=marine sediment metagenome TaxID=412755 RepID=A0A0F9QZ82_9ZZZZ